MGVPVTVDSDDLQTLLFATAAIKSVEVALKAQKNDPFAEQALPRYTEASDNLAKAWRDATRRRDMPQLFRDPTPHELSVLRSIFFDDSPDPDMADRLKRTSIVWLSHHPRSLVSLGLVELGNERYQIIWGDGRVSAAPFPPKVFARLTWRGIEVLRTPGVPFVDQAPE